MTATTGSEVLDEIQALFSWNPPRLIPATRKSPIISPVTPSLFYDKHLSSTFVLKEVVRLPSLVQDLAKNVDSALDTALSTRPPLYGLITADQRADQIDNLDRFRPDEKGVAEFYYLTTANYCLEVASMLALYPSTSFSQWQSLLTWTGGSSNYTVTDGQLFFRRKEGVHPNNKTWAVVVDGMGADKRRIFEEMGQSMSTLATWEIRSTSAEDGVMNAVLDLGKFSWTFPNAFRCRSTECSHLRVTGVVVGHDAEVTPWSFPNDSSYISDIQRLATLKRPVTRQVTRLAASLQLSVSHGSPTKHKSKKRKRNEEEEERYNAAQSLVQQAWAQAVRADSTVIVLHSGNHELVCVRHRASQTLYVSDVIEPPACVNPGYGKLQVGVYIAAIQDAIDRWKEPPGDDSDPMDDDEQDEQDHSRGSGSDSDRQECSTARKAPTDDELVAIKKTIHVASEHNMVLIYLQYDIYDSQIPALFIRSGPSHSRYPISPFSPQAISTCGLEECLTIVLTSEISQGLRGAVHRGTLKPEMCDGTMPLDVVVKLAFDPEQRDALEREYEVYCHLRSNGVLQGITTVLGLFDDSEDCACGLVMLYAGVPLATELQSTLSVSDRKSALSTLESIHRAGRLHGDIRSDNILIGDSGITITDFGYSEKSDNQKAKDHEIAQLRDLLGLESESH